MKRKHGICYLTTTPLHTTNRCIYSILYTIQCSFTYNRCPPPLPGMQCTALLWWWWWSVVKLVGEQFKAGSRGVKTCMQLVNLHQTEKVPQYKGVVWSVSIVTVSLLLSSAWQKWLSCIHCMIYSRVGQFSDFCNFFEVQQLSFVTVRTK